MKKLMITVSLISFFVFGNMPVVRTEDALTVEGVWEQVSTNTKAWETENGKRLAIMRAGDHYEVKWVEGETTATYSGDGTRIVLSRLEYLCEPDDRHGAGSDLPDSVCQEVKDQQVVINVSYVLSNDGNFLTKMQDGRWVYWDDNQRFTHYEVKPNFYTTTLKRISSTVPKTGSSGDHAYPADCSNPKDMCLGNLVAMTYFCGGNTDCTYVCCPRGLPYLNHCDCKCYATSDFDCHSYSKATEQPKQ